MYQQLNGKDESNENPETDESRRFWSSIEGTGKSRSQDVEWLKEFRFHSVNLKKKNRIKQGNTQIITEMITQQTRKVPNWKYPGPGGVQSY